MTRPTTHYVSLWRLTQACGWTLSAHTSITAAKRDLAARGAQLKREGAKVQRLGPCSLCVRWPEAPTQTTIYRVERAPERFANDSLERKGD